ncbi:MAG TPA: tetratricopeptide repeat protein, partial [Flavilitoribacter sp.]|nr:tetratricopeptide repeat protein [Flavilitoribacter sp.]
AFFFSCTVMLLGAGVRLAAQSDSLLQAFRQLPRDTATLARYQPLLKDLCIDQPKIAVPLAEAAFELAKSLKDTAYMIRFREYYGIAIGETGQNEKSRDIFSALKQLTAAARDSVGILGALSNIAYTYHSQGEWDLALQNYFDALALAEKLKLDTRIGVLSNNIGIIFRQQERYDEAIDYYEKSLAIKTRLADSTGMANTKFNLALIYSYKEDMAGAMGYYQEALTLYQALGREKDIASCYSALGSIYYNLGKLDQSEVAYMKAMDYFKNHREQDYYLIVSYQLGKIYLDRQQFAKAASYLSEGLERARMTDRKETLRLYLRDLAAASNGLGQYEKAYRLLHESMDLQDTLTEQKKLELTQEMQARFDLKDKNNQLAIQELQLAREKQQKQISYIVAGLLLALGLTVTVFLILRSKTARILRRQNEVIDKALKEKELLLKEIHHRVKNNLQFISSLLNLQSRHIEDEKALSALRESRSRVQAMSLIHQNLYQDHLVTGVNAGEYLDQLIDTVLESYNVSRKQVELKKVIDPVWMDIETAIPIGLIVNELICNAIKHAFTETESGHLTVTLLNQGDTLLLQVEDDGKGLANPDLVSNSGSFGFRLINLLLEKLKATLHVQSKPGTSVTLVIQEFQLIGES